MPLALLASSFGRSAHSISLFPRVSGRTAPERAKHLRPLLLLFSPLSLPHLSLPLSPAAAAALFLQDRGIIRGQSVIPSFAHFSQSVSQSAKRAGWQGGGEGSPRESYSYCRCGGAGREERRHRRRRRCRQLLAAPTTKSVHRTTPPRREERMEGGREVGMGNRVALMA